MSYCRFQNTSKDLETCLDTLKDIADHAPDEYLSRDEVRACKRLVVQCIELLATLGFDGDILDAQFLRKNRITDEVIDGLMADYHASQRDLDHEEGEENVPLEVQCDSTSAKGA